MGNLLWKCRKKLAQDIVLLLVGFDGAGKTKTAAVLEGTAPGSAAPTVGFQSRTLKHRGRTVRLHDVGGGAHFRAAWRHYFPDAHGLIFVLDAANRSRLPDVAKLLHEVLSHPYVAGKPILILANKQDLIGAMDDLDIVEKLNIEAIVNQYKCPTRVEAYSTVIPEATKKPYIDPGLKKGYEWLLNYIIHKYVDLSLRVHADVNKAKAQSDDSPTGFENPNYNIEMMNNDTQSGDSILVVQHDARNVKLSPLFGKRNVLADPGGPIELEPRTEIRKLSPIVRKKPLAPEAPTANEIFAQQLREFKSRENLQEIEPAMPASVSGSQSRITEVSLGDMSPQNFPKADGSRKILPPIKLNPIERPQSASNIIREQLENNSKKFTVNPLCKNKTSPDEGSIFAYDPHSIDEPAHQSEAVLPSL